MNKKLLAGILAVACVSASAVALTACAPEQEPPHEHTYAATWSKDETNHWYEPECDDAEKLALGAHAWVSKVTEEATEEKAGTLTYTCAVCGATKTESIDKKGHTYSTDWTADENGHWHESACDHDPSESVDHIFGDWKTVTEATHTEKGLEVRSCTVCNYTQIHELDMVGDHTYDMSKWANDEVNHWFEATCGHNLKDSVAAHNLEYKAKLVGASNEKYNFDGYHIKQCENCSYEVLENHNAQGGIEVTQGRTCEQDGITEITCSCGYVETQIDPKGHKFNLNNMVSNETHHWRDVVCEHSTATGDELIAVLNSNLLASKYAEHDFEKKMSADKTKFILTCKECHYSKEEPIVGVVDYGFKVYADANSSGTPKGNFVEVTGAQMDTAGTVVHVLPWNNGNDKVKDDMYFCFDNMLPAGSTFTSEVNASSPAESIIKVYELADDGTKTQITAYSTTVKLVGMTAEYIKLRVVDTNRHNIIIETNNTTKQFTMVPDAGEPKVEYSLDNGSTWTTYVKNSDINVSAGQKILFTCDYADYTYSCLWYEGSNGKDVTMGSVEAVAGKNKIYELTVEAGDGYDMSFNGIYKKTAVYIVMS